MPHLSVPGVLESLPAVSEFVKQAAAAAGLDERTTYRLRLAVVELVTNSIVHGYSEAGLSGPVDLRADFNERQLTIAIEDAAIPFDPSLTPPPTDLCLPIEHRKIGGLGVYLALQDVDSYRYERVGDRNRSILVINCPAP